MNHSKITIDYLIIEISYRNLFEIFSFSKMVRLLRSVFYVTANTNTVLRSLQRTALRFHKDRRASCRPCLPYQAGLHGSPEPIRSSKHRLATSACLQELRQSMLLLAGKFYTKIMPLIFNQIRAEISTTVGIDMSELGNRRSHW
ncbi:hypothetical protein SAMN05428978_100337 [Nitrosomonas sp. Nm34]|nr:hypothetical protein SAMN05428978_100337 [Nitrosomonas sp. Nm34]